MTEEVESIKDIQGRLDFDPSTSSGLTHEERKVWDIISVHRGRENAITGNKLQAMTEIEYDRIRQIISHLITEHGRLIASGAYGYFVPVTAEEVSAATRSLRHRGIMILVRAAKLQKISLEEIFHQARMEFGGN